jgi:hypothetical protein
MAPRSLQPPTSGGDRKHFARELEKARYAQAELVKRCDAAYATAHALNCREWNARQFIGGPADPSPTLGDAIGGGFTLLKVRCRYCRRGNNVPLLKLIWPYGMPIMSLAKVLYCQSCWDDVGKKRRPEIVQLIDPSGSRFYAPDGDRR